MTDGRASSLLLAVGVLLASVAVPAGPALAAADSAEFDPPVVQVRQGETATINVTVPNGASDTYQLGIGSRDEGFLVRTTVSDADGDGEINVTLDARTAGEGDPSSYLDVSEGDALRNATQVTPTNDPDRPLPAGTYDLNLSADGEVVTIGTLAVNGAYEGETETTRSGDDGRETTTLGDAGTNFVYEGDAITLQNASGQPIRGETTLDAGTPVVVRIQSDTFIRTTEVTVSENGTFAATFDLFDVAAGTTVEVHASYDGTTLAADVGRIVGCADGCARATTTGPGGDDETTLSAVEINAQSVVEVTRSKTARIPVTFGDAEELTVSIGGPEVNYVVTGTVRDTDGDGRAVVTFDTARAGFDSPTLASDDTLEQKTETSLSATLAPGTYEVTVYRGQNASGEAAAVGQVVIYEAGGSPPTETTADQSNDTATTVATDDARDPPSSGDSGNRLFGGVGMIAVGGVLAVVGIGVLLGLFRR